MESVITMKRWNACGTLMTPEEQKQYTREVSRHHYERHLEEIQAKREANREQAKAYALEYYAKNREMVLQKRREYKNSARCRELMAEYNQRPDVKARHCAKVTAWTAANREKVYARRKEWRARTGHVNKYDQHRRDTEPMFRLKRYLRNRINRALKNNSRCASTVELLGCTAEQLAQHLESMFQPGMTWDNWSLHGWHVDHIRPLAVFDLTDPVQLAEACHYTNLQPLWAADNIRKGAKVL